MEKLLGQELGRGGFGIVYANKRDKSTCIKISHKKESCRSWSNEHKKIKRFMKTITKHRAYRSLRMVKVVDPTKFIETNDECYMVLPRIYRPEGTSHPGKTIQAYLDEPSANYVYPGRGEFIGLKQIRQYIPEKDLKRACFELGLLLGLIHFVGKNDAYDLEVYIGKEHGKKKSRFYISDFDQSENINDFDSNTIERMQWSITALPYFPTDHSSELYQLFRQGYSMNVPQQIVDNVFSGI
jgi:hypothetical protein